LTHSVLRLKGERLNNVAVRVHISNEMVVTDSQINIAKITIFVDTVYSTICIEWAEDKIWSWLDLIDQPVTEICTKFFFTFSFPVTLQF